MPDTGKHAVESDTQFAASRASDILQVNHSTPSLLKASSMFPLPTLSLQEQEEQTVAAEIPPPQKETPQKDDKKPTKETATPIPDDSILADIKRPPVRTPLRQRDIDYDYGDDDDDYEPVRRPVARRTPQREESIVAQNTIAVREPVYPTLPQLPTAAPAITQASYQPPYAQNITSFGAGDWQAPLRQAAEQLRYAIEQTPNGRTQSNEMRLRMLEMLLGNKGEAAKPIQSADATVNKFMVNQVLGFATLLDDSIPDNRGRYITAAYRLNEGLMDLQNLCPLKLKNVTFVKSYYGYGQFNTRPSEFQAGDPFTVYVEPENLTVQTTGDGFEVKVAISYEIRDVHANVVAKEIVGKPVEMTLSRKREYFMGISSELPANLVPGQYHMRISMTDLNDPTMHYAEEQIPFRVVPASASEQQSAADRNAIPYVGNPARYQVGSPQPDAVGGRATGILPPAR
jgi:hypothetical protein